MANTNLMENKCEYEGKIKKRTFSSPNKDEYSSITDSLVRRPTLSSVHCVYERVRVLLERFSLSNRF